jgi:hypothetical protein
MGEGVHTLRKSKTMRFIAVLFVVVSAASGATAGEKGSLKGLDGVGVLVEDMSPDAVKGGLTKAAIQTDVELTLRRAGIRVLSFVEEVKAPGQPYLYVNISATTGGCGPYSLSIELHQKVQLARNPDLSTSAATWSASGLGAVGIGVWDTLGIRGFLKDLVHKFANDYLSVNPR